MSIIIKKSSKKHWCFDQFLIRKSMKKRWKILLKLTTLFVSILDPFWTHFGTPWDPLGGSWAPKMGPKRVVNIEQSLFFFGAVTKISKKSKKLDVGPLGGPFWDPLGTLQGPSGPPKTPQEGPKGSKMGPKWFKNRPQKGRQFQQECSSIFHWFVDRNLVQTSIFQKMLESFPTVNQQQPSTNMKQLTTNR